MTDSSVSIIIPAFNEEEAIGPTLQKLVDLKIHEKYELIIVDDGSADGTAEIAAGYPVKLYRHHVNKGYGAALKTGVRKASGDKVIMMDSDGQHDPKYIAEVEMMLQEFDMVIGERSETSFQVKRRKAGKTADPKNRGVSCGAEAARLQLGIQGFSQGDDSRITPPYAKWFFVLDHLNPGLPQGGVQHRHLPHRGWRTDRTQKQRKNGEGRIQNHPAALQNYHAF